MFRKSSTMVNGMPFQATAKLQIWGKAKVDPRYDARIARRDACNALIYFSHYGNRQSDHGWEIDHIQPVSHGGSDSLYNLQPLQWRNNVEKGDRAYLLCAVTA